MASDANLIKGARDVAMGAANSIKAAGTGLDALGKASAQFVQQGTAEVKARTAAQNKRRLAADDKLAEAMELSDAASMNLSEQHYAEVQKAVSKLKEKHSACGLYDDECRRKNQAAVVAQTQRMNQQKDLREGNKEAYKNGLLSKSLTDDEKNIMAIYMDPNASEYTLRYDRSPMSGGQAIYAIDVPTGQMDDEGNPIMEKKEYSESDITKMFDKQIDVKGKEANSKYALQMYNDGLEGVEYNDTDVGLKYNGMINKDNIQSFTHDDMGFGSLKNDMLTAGGPLDEALLAAAKDPNNNFGIEVGPGDTGNWYDNIDDSDRKILFNALTNPEAKGSDGNSIYDEDLHKTVVVDYHKRMAKKNSDKGKLKKEQAEERARLAKIQELKEKKMLKRFDAGLDMAIDNNASANDINELISKYQLESGKETTSTSQEVEPVADKVVVENTNYKEGKDDPNTASMEVSTDVLRGITKQLNDPNARGIVGYQGYYYKDGENNYRKFDNKQDFIKKQKIKVKDGENEDQAIARFNAKKNKGLVGGKATSYDTIYSDEQLSSAEDRVIDKTTTSKTTNSAIGTDKNGNPIIIEPKVKTADNII